MGGRLSLGETIRVGQLFDLPNWPVTPPPSNRTGRATNWPPDAPPGRSPSPRLTSSPGFDSVLVGDPASNVYPRREPCAASCSLPGL